MIAVIFEVLPKPEHRQDYFDHAEDLRPLLDGVDGFLSIERFQSLMNEGKVLSLSFWRDEEAVQRWRQTAEHRHAQAMGRGSFFENYRLRIASVVRDYGMHQRDEVPADSLAYHGRA